MEINTLLGERISNARVAKGYSQNQFANRLGVQKSTLKNWENDRTSPRSNRLNQIAGILDIPLVWLLAGAETPKSIEAPNLEETASIERKLELAEKLVGQLSLLLTEIRASTRRVQRDIDDIN